MWSILQALTVICRSRFSRPPAKYLHDDNCSPKVTLTCSKAEHRRGIFKPQVGHIVQAKRIICCGASGGAGDGKGRGSGDCCIRGRGKRRRGVCCYSDAAWGSPRHGAKVRMHLAGREGAGEKQPQHSPRGLFWTELSACGKVSCTSRSGLAFPHPQRRLRMALFNCLPWNPSAKPCKCKPCTHTCGSDRIRPVAPFQTTAEWCKNTERCKNQ